MLNGELSSTESSNAFTFLTSYLCPPLSLSVAADLNKRLYEEELDSMFKDETPLTPTKIAHWASSHIVLGPYSMNTSVTRSVLL